MKTLICRFVVSGEEAINNVIHMENPKVFNLNCLEFLWLRGNYYLKIETIESSNCCYRYLVLGVERVGYSTRARRVIGGRVSDRITRVLGAKSSQCQRIIK